MRVEVRSKVPGVGGPVLPAVLVELDGETVVARELIRRAVLEQITVSGARTMLDRQYSTAEEVTAMAAAGAVKPPAAAPDPAVEVARALRAFERRAFVLFCGGRQVESLDETLTLRLGEPIVFLRLVPLVGG